MNKAQPSAGSLHIGPGFAHMHTIVSAYGFYELKLGALSSAKTRPWQNGISTQVTICERTANQTELQASSLTSPDCAGSARCKRGGVRPELQAPGIDMKDFK